MPTGIPCPAHKIGWYFYPNDLAKSMKSPLTVHWIGPYAVMHNKNVKESGGTTYAS